ncbi:tetratricopeptide repeat protein [Streptomyces polyrhachis]|uniref:Tetratricopeptide repeat protein n=1 Tax=Streptomyces polyrhachis TaxID=1282885 RepID=A0ABW2GF83_9ACTN
MTDEDTGPDRGPAAPPPDDGDRGFFGRERELRTLREDISQAGLDTLAGRPAPRCRLLLIAGRPGSGRSALAAELAARVGEDYPDGVLRATLGPDTPRRLLETLGIPCAPGAEPDELAQAAREALGERRTLLILDEVHDPELLASVLPDNRDCLVVAIAEGPLTGVPDVRPCTLGGLETAAAVELIARRAGGTRIACDPEAAQLLAEECAGLPGALTLVAGWLAVRPEAAVSHALRRFRAIPGDRPMTRAFRLAHEELPAPAAQLLRLLALAPAGLVDAQLGSALAGSTLAAARRTLADFARQGLLRPLPGAQELWEVPRWLRPQLAGLLKAHDRPSEALLARARMLERLITLLGSCQAAAQEPQGTGDPALRKALEGVPRPLRFSGAPAAREWLRTRLPALPAAAREAALDGELDTLARRYIAALTLALRTHLGAEAAAPELYELHETVLAVARRRALRPEQAAALLQLGDLDAFAGRREQALGRYREALAQARESRQPPLVGRALESLGCTYQELGDFERAADWYGRALDLCHTGARRDDEARLRSRLGAVYTHAGRWGQALREWRAAVAAYRRLRDQAGVARALGETARVQEYAGRPQECLRTCEEALESARLAGDDRLRAAVGLRMADALERLGDPVAAEVRRSAALRLLDGGAGAAGADGPDRADGPDGADGAGKPEGEGAEQAAGAAAG